MEDIDNLRERAGLLSTELCQLAKVSPETWRRMSKKLAPVSRTMVYRVLNVLNQRLGTSYSLNDIDVLVK